MSRAAIDHGMKPVERTCPPCEAGVTSQRELLRSGYKRVYMCLSHREMYDRAVEREERTEVVSSC